MAKLSPLAADLRRAGLLVNRRAVFHAAAVVLTVVVIASHATRLVPRPIVPPLVIAFHVLLVLAIVRQSTGLFVPILARGKRSGDAVCLTFDDGPDPEYTPRILDVLRDHGAHATFFVVGEQATNFPEIVRRIVAEGHALGCHTQGHPALLNLMGTKRLAREIGAGKTAVEAAAGVPVRWYRQVAGLVNPRLARALVRTDLVLVGWTARALEGRAKSPDDLRGRILRGVRRWARPGAIFNLHDRGIYKPDLPAGVVLALPDLLAALRQRDLRVVSLDEMVADAIKPSPAS
jgi:peptidoglycan/xylan/chitin deacetylase (PgdA/CDA1 family)